MSKAEVLTAFVVHRPPEYLFALRSTDPLIVIPNDACRPPALRASITLLKEITLEEKTAILAVHREAAVGLEVPHATTHEYIHSESTLALGCYYLAHITSCGERCG